MLAPGSQPVDTVRVGTPFVPTRTEPLGVDTLVVSARITRAPADVGRHGQWPNAGIAHNCVLTFTPEPCTISHQHEAHGFLAAAAAKNLRSVNGFSSRCGAHGLRSHVDHKPKSPKGASSTRWPERLISNRPELSPRGHKQRAHPTRPKHRDSQQRSREKEGVSDDCDATRQSSCQQDASERTRHSPTRSAVG